jgi:23S rRNA (cytidine1920-2'-O)/16S rRNA (cytidine1409-2'-O)-methyltransferase
MGHYVADLHMPLQCTRNYNGQETWQVGVHERFESEMTRSSSAPTHRARPAVHLADPRRNHGLDRPVRRLVPEVLQADLAAKRAANGRTDTDRYYQKLWELTGDLVVRQISDAASHLSSLWYTAWVDAANPHPEPFDELPTVSVFSGVGIERRPKAAPSARAPPEPEVQPHHLVRHGRPRPARRRLVPRCSCATARRPRSETHPAGSAPRAARPRRKPRKSQRLVLAGEVLVDDAPAAKPGHEVPDDCALRVRRPERFVGRGGYKLEEAFARFPSLSPRQDLRGRRRLHRRLHRLPPPARRGQGLRGRRRPVAASMPASPPIPASSSATAATPATSSPATCPGAELAVTDVSFISLRLILPAIDRLLRPGGETVALVKPQFEAAARKRQGGVVAIPPSASDRRTHPRVRRPNPRLAMARFLSFANPSPAGNVEFLSYWRKNP